MEVMSLIPADYAAANERGKFTLVGAGFTEISTKKFPYVHPLMFLLVRLKLTQNDVGKNRIVIRLIGEKGSIFRAQMDIDVTKKGETATEQFINIPCQLSNTKFDTPGEYNFEVEINGETKSQSLKIKDINEVRK